MWIGFIDIYYIRNLRKFYIVNSFENNKPITCEHSISLGSARDGVDNEGR